MVTALILAAGSGERFGSELPKAFVELAGRPLVRWSIDVLRDVAAIERIVVALPPGMQASSLRGSDGASNWSPDDGTGSGALTVVEGGTVRSESVRLALTSAGGAGEPEDLVLIHDAARPLLTMALAAATITALEGQASLAGTIAAVRMTDTVKRVKDGVVRETLDRGELWAAQTPQVFRRAALERALDVPARVLAAATDDAWLVERSGGEVGVVEASSENLKITTPLDLALATMLLDSRPG